MKRLRKQAISWLLIVAMVLTLLPVIRTPVRAAEEAASPVRFPSDVASYDAHCPVCMKVVTWKPYNGENSTSSNPLTASSTSTHFHLYLTQDQVYDAESYFLVVYRNMCFNLNGYSITASEGSKAAFACARVANFLDTYGGSVVTGYSGSASAGSAIHANSTTGDYRLYGGTWTKLSADTASAIVRFSSKGATITLYDGAVIDATGKTSAEGIGSAVTIGGGLTTAGAVQKATFTIAGGEIKGGTLVAGVTDSPNCAFLNILGGKVTSNVIVNETAKLTLSGAPIVSGNVTLAQGVQANITGLTKNASIRMEGYASGMPLTEAREDAEVLQGVFTAGNQGEILLGSDNVFYSFSAGMAIVHTDGKADLYPTAEQAVAAYSFTNQDILYPATAGQTITLAGDAYVDAAGKNISVNGSGKLYGMDSGNDSFETCATWSVGGTVEVQEDVISPVTGYRYLFKEAGYHRLELAITHVTLRTADEGMYYKARISCDETLASLVQGYGIALSIRQMPGTDFATAEDVEYTVFDRDDFVALYQNHSLSTNSCILTGILKTDNTKNTNSTNVYTPVYANLYLNLAGRETPLMSDEENIGKTTASEGFDGVGVSLNRLLRAISENWLHYSVENRKAIQAFVDSWKPYVRANTFPEMGGCIQVGFGREDITPDYSVPLAGYGNTHKRMSTSIQTRLYVTCVAITDQFDETILVVSMDLINCSWDMEIRTAISKATGVPTSNIAVSATHTHAAPDPDSTLDVIATYKQEFLVHAANAAIAAMADRSEAFAYTGSTYLEKMNTVRHYLMADGTYAGDNFGTFTGNTIVEPAEKADNQLQVIQFAREGKQDVVLANWQAHATLSTGSKYYKISADIIGSTREHFETATGELFVYFAGASGNINPESKIKTEHITEDYWEYGNLLSQATIRILENMTAAKIERVKTKSLIFTGNVDHTDEDKLTEANEVVALYKTDGKTAANTLARQYGFQSYYHANGVVRRSKYGATRDFEISVFTLGGISFAIAPSEMFSSHGEYIKANTPGTTFILTSANGKVNYIPNAKAYDYGCYERHAGYFTRETGDELAQTYVDMLLALQ